jgi:WD40 repeat protein
MKKTAKILLILLVCSYIANAQNSLKILDYDYSKYPDVTAKFFLFDNSGFPVSGLTLSNFAIRDNGLGVNSKNSVTCPVSVPEQKLSLTITFDLALSTLDSINSNFEIGRSIAKNLVTKFNKSEISITSYDIRNYLNREFTDSIPLLLNEIDNFQPARGSLFDIPFLEEPANSIKIVNRGKNKKIIIFITDGSGSINDRQIIQKANADSITIYALVIGKKAPTAIKKISDSTGGWFLENINKSSDISLLSNIIRALAYNYKPCEIIWNSGLGCVNLHEIEITIPSIIGVKDIINFELLNSQKSMIVADPQFMGFSSVDTTKTSTLSMTLTAKNRDVLIDSLQIDEPFTIIEGNVTKYTLKKDEFLDIKIKYAPKVQALVFSVLKIFSDACDIAPIYITGGFPNVPPVKKTIQIVHPNGGETLIVGDTSFVSWIGLLKKDVIQCEYSIDNGKKWDTLNEITKGLKEDWIIPNKPSDSCLVKITQIYPNNITKVLVLNHNDKVNCGFFNKEGDVVLTACADNTAVVWDSNTGDIKWTLKGHNKPVTWASFSPNDRFIATVSEDSTIKIWNQSDFSLLKTLSEHKNQITSVSWSESGEYFATSDYSGRVIIWDTNFTIQKDIKLSFSGQTYFVCFNPVNSFEIATANTSPTMNTSDSLFGSTVKVWNWKNYNSGDTAVKIFNTSSRYCKHVTYNTDGTKIAATTRDSDPKRLFIWDYNIPDKPLYSITHNFDVTSNNSINFSSFFYHPKLKKEVILTSGTDNNARLWYADNGLPVLDSISQDNIIGTHINSVSSAVSGRLGSRVLTTSWDKTAKIWKIENIILQQDISDSVFRIDYAKAELKSVDFGQVSKGEVLDSIVNAVIINKSSFSYPIAGISIEGTNKEDFAINDELQFPIILNPNDSIAIELRFLPTDYGTRTATLVVTIPANVIKDTLTGFGIEHDLSVNNPLVDFNIVDIGNYKDTTFIANVENKTSKIINIDTIKLIGSYKDEFSITLGNEIKTLSPRQDFFLKLRLSPETLGRKNAQIQFDYQGLGKPTIINLFGEGIEVRNYSLTLFVKDVSGSPGDIVHIPIYITNISNTGIPENVSGFLVTMKFNSTLLEPESNIDIISDTIIGYERTLKINLPKTFGIDSILKDLTFKVGFGNDTISPLKLEYGIPIGLSKLHIFDSSAVFSVTGLCNDGGVRLFDPNGKIFLQSTNPSPAIGQTTINFGVLASGQTELYITDMVGKKVKSLINEFLTPGSYEISFNAGELFPGIYTYILKSSSKILTKQMQIIK